jgi:hypothetical protein
VLSCLFHRTYTGDRSKARHTGGKADEIVESWESGVGFTNPGVNNLIGRWRSQPRKSASMPWHLRPVRAPAACALAISGHPGAYCVPPIPNSATPLPHQRTLLSRPHLSVRVTLGLWTEGFQVLVQPTCLGFLIRRSRTQCGAVHRAREHNGACYSLKLMRGGPNGLAFTISLRQWQLPRRAKVYLN